METTEQLRDRLAALEDEHGERLAQAHAALAAEQDRAYWLDRWNLDLNALMRRRGAAQARAGLRGAAGRIMRLAIKARRYLAGTPGVLATARARIEEEDGRTEAAARDEGAASRARSPPIRCAPLR